MSQQCHTKSTGVGKPVWALIMRGDGFESKVEFMMLMENGHVHNRGFWVSWCRVSEELTGKFFLDEEAGSSTCAGLRYSVGACSSGGGGTACRVIGRIFGVDDNFSCVHLSKAKSG